MTDPPDAPVTEGAAGGGHSLLDDVEILIADVKTYFDAEVAFQKTRASFVADRLKRTIALGLTGLVVALVAIMALAIGLIIALTPLVSAWGATAIVAGGLLLIVFLMMRRAGKYWNGMIAAMRSEEDDL